MDPTKRLAAYNTVATGLSLLSDHRLGEVVAAAEPLGSGIGGRSAALDVHGVRVFVKRVPLTDVELRPENVRSTANVFGLPTFYQYGVGSAGFGAWRELAAHTVATHWVLGQQHQGFPLLYHWRVLPDVPPTDVADEFGGIDGAVAHWDGSPAVRDRLEAIGRSTASLVLFLEHVPQTLAAWLPGHPDRASWAERELARGTAFLSSHGLVHFDAHFENLLTDGRSVYFADFGLALSAHFDLSPAEAAFLATHRRYDHGCTMSQLLRFHPVADGGPKAAAIAARHAEAVAVIDGFHRRLITESRRVAFPAAEYERVLEPAGAE